MKRLSILLVLFTILSVSCKKDNNDEIIDQEQDLRISNQEFLDSDWTFDSTGDSAKDQIIGLWFSYEVSKADTVCNACDTFYTWVFESTGRMIKRNNYSKENEISTWEIDNNGKYIYYPWKDYKTGGTGYRILTDTITIEKLNDSLLWTSHFIDYPPTTKMDIKFDKLK
ncbi:hypothetical protein [Maribellus sediminis]|uniref:hypothetical protein n=1 Tax=Maribellus sediminis TaxID=2696285 RepID=UPI0014307B94|nr:hypothetical protein [Maribellus sediminis]